MPPPLCVHISDHWHLLYNDWFIKAMGYSLVIEDFEIIPHWSISSMIWVEHLAGVILSKGLSEPPAQTRSKRIRMRCSKPLPQFVKCHVLTWGALTRCRSKSVIEGVPSESCCFSWWKSSSVNISLVMASLWSRPTSSGTGQVWKQLSK